MYQPELIRNANFRIRRLMVFQSFCWLAFLLLMVAETRADAASLPPIVVNCIFADSPQAGIRGHVGDSVAIYVVGGRCRGIRSTMDAIIGPDSISQGEHETYKLMLVGRGSISMISLFHEKAIVIPFVVFDHNWHSSFLELKRNFNSADRPD